MRIATWNVNSIGVRLPHLLDFLKTQNPDVVLLQELKCEAAKFPRLEIEALGYRAEVLGQKTYNGVALLSKHPIEDVKTGLPGDEADTQARYVEATVKGIRIASIYLPNGNPVDSEKYPYKLSWCGRLIARAKALLAEEIPVVLGGDFNVIPAEEDCYDPAAWAHDALFLPESRRKWRTLLNLGYTDALRALHPSGAHYTFWDYQAGAWPKNNGIRIDHFLLSPKAADRLETCEIARDLRGLERASDHVPVVVTLRD